VATPSVLGYLTPSHPWEEVHVDPTGPLPRTTRGNAHIIVRKCALMGAVEIAPMKPEEAEETGDNIVDLVFNRHGVRVYSTKIKGKNLVTRSYVISMLHFKQCTSG
jgi:hypothetical protein